MNVAAVRCVTYLLRCGLEGTSRKRRLYFLIEDAVIILYYDNVNG